MEYISSKNIVLLICDTLKLFDSSLIEHGERTAYIVYKMLEAEDEIWAINRVCETLKLDTYEESEAKESDLEKILAVILDYAVENGLCEDSVVYRDLFDTKIMGLITPRPSYVINKFNSLYEQSPKAATDFYYKLSQDSDYIRRYRIKKRSTKFTKKVKSIF